MIELLLLLTVVAVPVALWFVLVATTDHTRGPRGDA